ncbi:hypothetical protein BV22DRAFT_1037147 [Leucogyrophana mollusca]|uniref:Uncharacterized protein n=1 Tax=Leucogyrophana mollusca TaxID=85980 RepID=A0ACB8BD95_9AGAM|nr:hypothetical protein BV22DRAFT_1037147 [Leucogyrophana mollusca]
MTYNPYPSQQQPQPQPFQRSAYPQGPPPPGPGSGRPMSAYAAPSQAYDPRWYQQQQQPPSSYPYPPQQAPQRPVYSQQAYPPQSQPFRQPPHPSQMQAPPPPGAVVTSRGPPAEYNAPPSAYGKPLSVTPGSRFAPPPPPPALTYTPSIGPTGRTPQPGFQNLQMQSPAQQSPATQSRRPLPTPRARPESMPPPARQTPTIQAPAPSRPAILTHAASLSADSPSSTSPPTSASSNNSRRPLPTPLPRSTKHASLDLRMRPPSPVEESGPEQILPSSLARKPTLPASSMESHSLTGSSSESNPTQTKFVPLWKRNLQSSSPSPAQVSGLSGTSSIERRSTVSGVVAPPKLNGPSIRARSPERPPQVTENTQTSPSRRPLPSSPLVGATPPTVPQQTRSHNVTTSALSRTPTTRSLHSRVPASSGTDDDISSPSDVSTEEEDYIPKQDLRAGEGDQRRTPSPQYGIRDLPQRSRTIIASKQDPIISASAQQTNPPLTRHNTRNRPTRSATLPQPPISNVPQPREPPNATSSKDNPPDNGRGQSLTLRLAAASLGGDERSSSPTRREVPSSPAWPPNVPPLPRTPGMQSLPFSPALRGGAHPNANGNGTSSLPRTPQMQGQQFSPAIQPSSPALALQTGNTLPRTPLSQPSSPTKMGYNGNGNMFGGISARQREKQREFVNLDDEPPPSLRRTPSPSPSIPSIQIDSISSRRDDSLPQRHWTPSANGNRNRALASPPKIESPAPVGGRNQQANIPTISFPGGDDDDSDDSGFGPSITVSGPEAPRISAAPPQISISGSSSPPHRGAATGARPPPSSQRQEAQYGSRHTHIQENGNAKRNLPPPPMRRAGGLSCGGCGGPIIGRIVSAIGVRWHPECFRCTICNELLEHVSSYEHEGRPYCHLDYHESFAPRCYHCQTAIIDERFITLDDEALGKRTYHEQHFFCAECGDPFLAPSAGSTRTGELSVTGDGAFEDDDVGFTVYKGHPYCEACHVRLRMPKCKRCKRSIRDGTRAVEALGGKWCWECFVCASCEKPFDDPSFFLRDNKPFCEPCFSLILRNEV